MKKLKSLFETNAFINETFDKRLCIVCTKPVYKNGDTGQGPRGKITCSYWCYRTARDFQIKLTKMQKDHPNFVEYCIAMMKIGIPLTKINQIYKLEKKRKFIGPYKIE